MRNKKQKTDTKKRNKKKNNGVEPSPTNTKKGPVDITKKDPEEMIKDPEEMKKDTAEMKKDPEEMIKGPEEMLKDPEATIEHPVEMKMDTESTTNIPVEMMMHSTDTITQSTEPVKHSIESKKQSKDEETMELHIETMKHPEETINYPVELAIEPIKMMKHPLEHTWTFWMFTNYNKQKWEDNLQKLATFDTVEDYWCLYHFMKLPSELQIGQDYAIFKKGIRPMWEDPGNRKGGRWLITLDKRKEPFMDRLWLDAVLIMIGENFKYNDNVCGICINVRPKSKIALWTADARNNEKNLEIGEKLKRTLAFKMIYQVHNSSDSCHTL